MYTEEFLRRIGFTGFKHFREKDRDGFERLARVLFVEEGCFTVRLLLESDTWVVELFKFDGTREDYSKYFKKDNPDLEQIINTLFTANF